MNLDRNDTAVVFIDPQNEVLSETGLAWPLVRESLQENNTIANMERIFEVAKSHRFEVFISPHYFYPTDKGWTFNGPLETDEAASGYFARKGILNLDGLDGSGADWLAHFKPYIEDGKTIVAAPHRVWGPEWGYGYTAALINFAFLAHAVLTTDEAVKAMGTVSNTWPAQ